MRYDLGRENLEQNAVTSSATRKNETGYTNGP
jgi:hypothetical protein